MHILQGKDKNIIISSTEFETRSVHHYLLTDNTVIKKTHGISPNLLVVFRFYLMPLKSFLFHYWHLMKKETESVMEKDFTISFYPNVPKRLSK